MEQIVALKFIGVPLKDVGRLLRTGANDLLLTLQAQRAVMESKRERLEQAITAIADGEAALSSGGATAADALKRIIEVIEMQNNGEEWRRSTRRWYKPRSSA